MVEAGLPAVGGAAGDVGGADGEWEDDDGGEADEDHGRCAGKGVLDLAGGEAEEAEYEEESELLDTSENGSVADEEDRDLLNLSPAPATSDGQRNQVLLPVEQFRNVLHDFVFYAVSVQHHLSREAVGDILRLQCHSLKYRSPYRQQKLAGAAVDLREKLFDACPAKCVAFAAGRSTLDACDMCKQARYKPGTTTPRKQVTYWPMIPWLTAMLGDPTLGLDMTAGMAHARQRASQPRISIDDWYDGSNFRNAVQQGYFQADTDVAFSLSADGFEAWRQQGFQGWPVVATILNLPADSRTSLVNQVLLCVTPEPKQPADLESYSDLIAEELHTLAIGVPGVTVAGRQGLHTLRGFMLHVSTDMPAGDKIANATGHNGYQPNRFRAFSGVYYESNRYYPPVNPRTNQVLFAVDNCPAPRRTAASVAAQVNLVEGSRRNGRPQSHAEELSKRTGFKGYSLFLSPSSEQRAKYPALKYLWDVGRSLMSYDCMHLSLLNVTPLLWLIFFRPARRASGIQSYRSFSSCFCRYWGKTTQCTGYCAVL